MTTVGLQTKGRHQGTLGAFLQPTFVPIRAADTYKPESGAACSAVYGARHM